MRISADTNILVRAAVRDDPVQTEVAEHLLEHAEVVALTIPSLCEFVWVLHRAYKRPRALIAASMRDLINSANVETDRQAVAAGLAMLDIGGDFADGVIAFQGQALGGETFASFDRVAVGKLRTLGLAVHPMSN